MKFTLPMPPSINETYRTHGNITYKTKIAKEWEKEAGWLMKNVYHGTKVSEKQITIKLDFYFKRDRDIDSGIKILLDLLQGKFYKNDRQVETLIVQKNSDKLLPRVEIEIYESVYSKTD